MSRGSVPAHGRFVGDPPGPPSPGHTARSERRRGERGAFGRRMLLALAGALSVAAVAQYLLTSQAAADRVLDNQKAVHDSSTRFITEAILDQERSTGPAGEGERSAAVRRTLEIIVAGEATDYAALYDRAGLVAKAGTPDSTGPGDGGELALRPGAPPASEAVREALRSGRGYAGPEPEPGEEDEGRLEIVSVIDLAGRRLALEVDTNARALDAELGDMRLREAATLLLGFGIGLIFFYVLGGRELVARYRVSEELSLRDGLTGIGNHRAFQEEIRRAAALAHRTEQPLSAVMFDIADFKAVNDRFGHLQGDRVLCEVADELAGTRGGDHAFRVGGDEFVLLLPATALDAASEAVERIRHGVEVRTTGVCVRAGLAALGPEPDTGEALWARIDDALGEARTRGDPVVVAEPLPEPAPSEGAERLGSRSSERQAEVEEQPAADGLRPADRSAPA